MAARTYLSEEGYRFLLELCLLGVSDIAAYDFIEA
jgi:hypothetical protein